MNTFPRSSEPKKRCVARALFDNLAETPDELAFRRGDVLTVLEQNTGGLEGWWLCSLRGRQGICPGNRLRLLAGVFDTGHGVMVGSHLPPGADTGSLQRRSWSPSRVKMSPLNQSTASLPATDLSCSRLARGRSPEAYDTPPSPKPVFGSGAGQEQYDVPRALRPQPSPARGGSALSTCYVSPRRQPPPPPAPGGSDTQDKYDIPRPHHQNSQTSLANRVSGISISSAGSSIRSSSCGGSSSNRSSLDPGLDPAGIRRQPLIPENSAPVDPYPTYDSPRPGVDVDLERALHGTLGRDRGPTGQSEVSEPLTYDFPRPTTAPFGETYDTPKHVQESSALLQAADLYDFPRTPLDIYDFPRSNLELSSASRESPLPTSDRSRLSAPSDTSDGVDELDVTLRPASGRPRPPTSRNATYWLLTDSSGESVLSASSLGEARELPLDTDAGIEAISRMEHELQATLSKLFTFIVPQWRTRVVMEKIAMDLKLTVVRLRAALKELVQFAYSAIVNTSKGPENSLGQRFVQLLRPLEESVRLIEQSAGAQDTLGWTPEALVRPPGGPADQLDRLTACAQSLTDDVRQVAAFIRGNSSLLFRRQLVDQYDTASYPTQRAGLLDDYDYVGLQTAGSLAQESDEVRRQLPEAFHKSFDNLMKESQVPVNSRAVNTIDDNDKQVLQFYSEQTTCHHAFLNNAIDAFFQTIRNNQPPKVFVAHGKFVILSAHKLVYIGDTVHRNVVNQAVRRQAQDASDRLFACLKRTVQSTKTAALQFPSAIAVQEMADAVLDVTRSAGELKLIIEQAAAQ